MLHLDFLQVSRLHLSGTALPHHSYPAILTQSCKSASRACHVSDPHADRLRSCFPTDCFPMADNRQRRSTSLFHWRDVLGSVRTCTLTRSGPAGRGSLRVGSSPACKARCKSSLRQLLRFFSGNPQQWTKFSMILSYRFFSSFFFTSLCFADKWSTAGFKVIYHQLEISFPQYIE
jgi:hypothetical protein